MNRHFHRKEYKIRPSTTGRGLEVTLPSSLKDDGVLKVGDTVSILFDSFVVISPPGETLNPEKLANAIELCREEKKKEVKAMSTKEEIREGINQYLTKRFICDIDGEVPSDECLHEADALLAFLHSQGVKLSNGESLIEEEKCQRKVK